MPKTKKLIEVAMPIKEISAESVRDKSIRHGHISTLHLWWARRPLPVCRAVVFASLVPDPLDDECPPAFREAVTTLLGTDSRYKPYKDIPYTAIEDEMPDNLRNRLMMFIGKFSDTFCQNAKTGKVTAAKDQLSNGSLIKWDNKNNPEIIGKARKLIWVAYNAAKQPERTFLQWSEEFDSSYAAIEEAERALYSITNRHIETLEITKKEDALRLAIESFQSCMPSVFDPFAGGGAIPLEAARLGCRSYGNDINPVAHIIEKGSLEFPQKYGKLIRYTETEFRLQYGNEGVDMLNARGISISNGEVEVPNRLSFDVEFYAKKLLKMAEKEVGYLYPADEKGNKPIAYYWARTATCSNPSCRAEVPLLKQFYLANTSTKKVYLNPIICGTDISFEIKEGMYDLPGWNKRGNLTCPCCGSVTGVNVVKKESIGNGLKSRLLTVISESNQGKEYRLPNRQEELIVKENFELHNIPTESMPVNYTQAIPSCTWGLSQWCDMFSNRQLKTLTLLVEKFNLIGEFLHKSSYNHAVLLYLSLWIDRVAVINTSLGRWDVSRENNQHPYSRQAIPMMFDYPESNPFCTSSGSALNQLDWITRYLDSESIVPFSVSLKNSSSGEYSQFDEKILTAVVTDPPYYDAIGYADVSDFFYVWLKRTIGTIYPLNFATPLTPKEEECTALKHYHQNSELKAKKHFENKLTQIFDAIELQTSDIVSIMFAHQSTEAWTTLCNSILGARMNITGSWPMDTEMANRAVGLSGAALESSVTVSCRPSQREGYGSYKKVKLAIEKKVAEEVAELYALGFRGADLLTACFGQAVSEFGKYQTVEKADGTTVTVKELLELAREAAFNALLKGFAGDEYTKFYIGWLQLNGMSDTDFDDAAKFTRIGLSIDVNELFHRNLLIKDGNKQALANYKQRMALNGQLGKNTSDILIDQVHRAMHLYATGTYRKDLLSHIALVASTSDNSFWRVLVSLKELLPEGDDRTQVDGLLSNKESLIIDCQKAYKPDEIQGRLAFGE